MQDLIHEYERSVQAVYGRIQALQSELPDANSSEKYSLEVRICKLRTMHRELHHTMADMREGERHVRS